LGVLLGIPLAFAIYRATQGMLGLFEIVPGLGYPTALGSGLLVVAVFATGIPARRASSVAPAVALKDSH